ncbi:MAG: hypothetical protein HYS13_00700 [Planctomycetia bacterium]|nr:hypothetical protein [Planctomycetia bacterium]
MNQRDAGLLREIQVRRRKRALVEASVAIDAESDRALARFLDEHPAPPDPPNRLGKKFARQWQAPPDPKTSRLVLFHWCIAAMRLLEG